MAAPHKIIVVLAPPKGKAERIQYAKSVRDKITQNARFQNLTPPPATVNADILALESAETAAGTRAKGTANERDARWAVVERDLQQWAFAVQQVVNDEPDADKAKALVVSIGMKVKKDAVRDKPDTQAIPGKVAGEVILIAKRGIKHASFQWEISTDQKTWTPLPATLKARTVIRNLQSNTMYFFRCRRVTKLGETNWSRIFSCVAP